MAYVSLLVAHTRPRAEEIIRRDNLAVHEVLKIIASDPDRAANPKGRQRRRGDEPVDSAGRQSKVPSNLRDR